MVWIATANEESRIPEPILNRMNTYSIQAPDRDGSRRVAQAIYTEIRSSHDWGKSFSEAPTSLALDRLAEMGPREMRRAIMNAFGSAKLAHRDEIQVDDIEGTRAPKKQRIGF